MRLRRIRVTPALYNPDAGRVLTTTEWEPGGWASRLRPGWRAERGDRSVVAATADEAKARLREWERP